MYRIMGERHGCLRSCVLVVFLVQLVFCQHVLVAHGACYEECRFSFCPYRSSYEVGVKNDVAFTGAICDPSGKVAVGHVDETGEAHVYSHGSTVAISKYSPRGLLQNYSPSFFKSFGLNDKTDLSGVGHETPQQNQASYLDGLCVVLPLRAYQVLNKRGGSVIDNKHPRDSPLTDCVAFSVSRTASHNAEDEKPSSQQYPQSSSPPPPPSPTPRRASTTVSAPVVISTPVAPPRTYPATREVPSTAKSPSTDTTYPSRTIRTHDRDTTTARPETSSQKDRSTYKPRTNGEEEGDKHESTPPPIDSLPVVKCSNGCPATSVIKPIYDKCDKQLNGRPKGEYFVFAGLDGESSNGKDCALVNTLGVRTCEGTFQEAEWCNDGFVCSGGSSYRPQIVKCVTADGGLCKAPDDQTDDIVLERTKGVNGEFVSCQAQ